MATQLAPPPADAGYDEDFALWSAEQAAHLRAGRFDMLDLENIAEEIESLGKRDRNTIRSKLRIACEHLIKLSVSRDPDPRAGWWRSVHEARNRIGDVLDDSPSLRREMPTLFLKSWEHAQRLALDGLRRPEEQTLARNAGAFLTIEQVMTVEDATLPRLD